MGGSARPKRRRAAGAALRYEHVRQRPSAWSQARETASRGECLAGCLVLLVVTAALIGLALTVMTWGPRLWGRVAPSVPGGGYGFAAVVGTLLPIGIAVLGMTLSRMRWRTRALRSLGWLVASLPGAAACLVWTVVVLASFRPKHRRDWDGSCYERGEACWVHVEYPWVWAVGVLSTVLVSAAVIIVAFRVMDTREKPAAA
ncbi:hypothetical protein OG458_19160 [Streptomyces sp. NBC_01281]|uniref:hypothetical protein n=1 Tax=Streptomyces sp. NBC_01281 TaxID=2903811 RepID=UPI002E159698|nr:hypothetical protein OG458_19160 [Streptomyces sp. NBC_01281]